MATPADPYFAGRVVEKPSKSPRLDDAKPLLLSWAIVYCFNLIVPLMFGWSMTNESGRFGMLFGILVVFASGYYLCFVFGEAVRTVVYGGWIVAASQFFPLPQIFAGSVGIGLAQSAGQATGRGAGNVISEFGGFIATVTTGGVLLIAAAVLGLIIRGIIALFTPRPASPPKLAS